MSKKISVFVSIAMMFLLSLYLAYDGIFIFEIQSDYYFLTTYLMDPQKYLYIISSCLIPILLVLHIPFLQPEYRTRINKHLFSYMMLRLIKISFYSSGVVLLCYLMAMLIYQYQFELTIIYLRGFIILFSFILYCFVFYTCVYVLSNKKVIAALSVYAVNILVLSIVYAVEFYILNGSISMKSELLFFMIYILLMQIIGICFLSRHLRSKECLEL